MRPHPNAPYLPVWLFIVVLTTVVNYFCLYNEEFLRLRLRMTGITFF
jgi:hypothetical protein